MGILIKNPETERVVRELAAIRGVTLTDAVDAAARRALIEARAAAKPRPTYEQIMSATERLRRESGSWGKVFPPVTKEEWDEINEVPGMEDDPA